MMSSQKRSKSAIARAVASVTIAAGIAVGGVSLAGATGDEAFDPPKQQSKDQGRKALDELSVFKDQSRKVADAGVTEDAARKLRGVAFDPALTRKVRDDAKHEVHVLAGDESVCISREEKSGGGAIGCTTPVMAADGEYPPVGVDYIDGGFRVTGLFADGTTDVAVELSSGERRPVEVRANVVSMTTSSPPAAISWTTANGRAERLAFRNLTVE